MTDPVSAATSSRIATTTSRDTRTPGRRLGRTALVSAATAATLLAGSAAAGAAPAGTGGSATGNAPQRLGSTPHAPAGAVRTGTPAAGTPVELSVGLRPRDEQAVKDFIAATTTEGNAQYHHYLSKGQFADTFGPTEASIAKVTAELRAVGLKPGKVSADGLSIPVTTTLAAATHAFGTDFASYQLKDGTTGFLNNAAPQVAGDISGIVSSVSGLNSLARRQTMHRKVTLAAAAGTPVATKGVTTKLNLSAAAVGGPELCQSAVAEFNNNGVSEGSLNSSGYGYVSAGNLARSYGLDHTFTSGAGATIGVLEMENFADSDLAAYQACYGTRVSVSRYKVDGGPKEAVAPATNNGIESLLDLEDIASLAPGASIIDYQGVDLDHYTNAHWLHTYQAMVLDDRASVLSISYGGCELDTDPNVISAENYYSWEAAAQGQTIVASSGDDGASGCVNDAGSPNQLKASVSDPASQPYVTGVGGTQLSGGIPITARTAWSGSGGGVSTVWPLNTTRGFQAGFKASGYSNVCHAASGYTCRQTPDVAANAAPGSSYPIHYGGDWGLVWGTSGASPTWAAMLAITNTQGACRGNGTLGWVNGKLYAAAANNYAGNFTDIASGKNYNGNAVGFYSGAGYDLPTGLGEPKAASLSAALCASGRAQATGVSTYHPVTPTRLLDTRQAIGVSSRTPIPANGMTKVQIEGNAKAAIPATGVTAVVLNVTVTQTAAPGYLTVWADGARRPGTSNINWVTGQTIANLVTVPVGGDGAVNFFTVAKTHVIADVQGYFTNNAGGMTLHSVAPVRALDTRSTSRSVPTNTTLTLPMAGHHGIPSNAKAMVLNMTVVGTGAGYLAAYPGGTATPTTSNINWGGVGTTLAGMAVVPIGNGYTDIRVSGSAHVIVDIFGYYTNDATGTRFTSIAPSRMLDTRYAIGIGTKTPIPAKHTISVQVTGRFGIPAGVKTVVVNLTALGDASASYGTAWASGASKPGTSNLNWTPWQVIANQIVVPVGADGKIDLYVDQKAGLLADISGYYM